MQRFNVLTDQLPVKQDRSGYAWRGLRGVTSELGLRWFGASVYELPDGQWTFPYHYHHGVEEWLCVVAGAPVLRDVTGERVLEAGDLVCFPSGTEGAHAVHGPGRVVMVSGLAAAGAASVSVYPDSGKLGVRPPGGGPDRLDFRRGDAVDYLGRRVSPAPRPVINALTIQVAPDMGSPPGFRTRYRELGPLLGGALLGGTVYELDPGERNGPYHYEIGNEECLLVLAGTPTLRHPAGRDELVAGDMVAFPEGADGAHQLINESTTVARVLILSTKREPRGCAYPDSGKLSTLGGVFRIADAVSYWDGETVG